MFRGSVKSTGYPLHSPVSPFTSPPVRHRVPSHFNWTLILQRVSFIAVLNTASCPPNVTTDAGYLWDRPAVFGLAIKKTLYLSGNFFSPHFL
jgi:hypothetical protein